MYIGHIEGVGATALTAVGVTMPVIMVISAFAALISMGGAPRASIMMGKGDRDSAEKIMCSALTRETFILLFYSSLCCCWGKYAHGFWSKRKWAVGYA